MADTWIQASFAFTCSHAGMALLEEAVLAAANLAGDFEPDPPSPEFLAVFPPVDDDVWGGLRSLFTDPDFPSFGAEIEGGNSIERPHISTVTLFGTTDFDPNAVARLIQRCCRETLEAAPIGFEYAGHARHRASVNSAAAGASSIPSDSTAAPPARRSPPPCGPDFPTHPCVVATRHSAGTTTRARSP